MTMCEIELTNFLDLEIPINWNLPEFDMMDPIINSFDNYTAKPIESWDADDVLNFINCEISEKSIPFDPKADLHRFKCISGYIFKTLTEEHCKLLSGCVYLGEIIFNAKEKYIRYQENEFLHQENIYNESKELTFVPSDDESRYVFFADDKSDLRLHRPGRPKLNYDNKTGKRSEKLWEFLLHLLQDTRTCPELIKWENFEEGMFKFVQSDRVARLWGSRKKNENMTYEKFSRAMRYYYKSEVLLPVPGRRLVYKFGPRAKGWKSISPIC